MEKKISVVVPTYRRPELLKKTLQALSFQDFELADYEVIVVSDGPDEATRRMVESFEEFLYIHFVSLPENRGPAAARNAGWYMASGTLIAFTDDDCLPETHWLSALWKGYEKHGAVAFTGKTVVPLPARPTDFERNTGGLETAAFITANCAIARTVLVMVRGFDENFRMAWREDSDLQFKLMQLQVPVIRLNEARVIHPVRETRWGVSIREQKKGMFDALLFKKFPQLFRQFIRPERPWNYYLIIALFAGMITGVATGNRWLAIGSATGWLLLTGRFIRKRLAGASTSPDHVAEMILTSLVIPFASVYWQFYGAVKYRVLFI